MRISDWSSDVCSSDLQDQVAERAGSGGYHAISSRRRSGAIIELVGIHGGVGGGEQRGAVAAIVGVECDADADAAVAGLAAGQADRVRDAAPEAGGDIDVVAPRADGVGNGRGECGES